MRQFARSNLPIAVPAFLITAVVLVLVFGLLIPKKETSAAHLSGTVLTHRPPAPNFKLRDQFGRARSKSSFRNRVVVLTFLWSRCKELCPIIAETLRETDSQLGKARNHVAFVVISTDPEGDTRSSVLHFSRSHGMLHRWYYLTGSRPVLTRVWSSFHIFAAPKNAPEKVRDSHTAATYLIDGQGRERAFTTNNPDVTSLLNDIKLLSGLKSLPAVSQAPAPEVGHPAPALALANTAGKNIALSDFRGRYVLLNFWATWCNPCRSEMPRLASWYRRLRSHKFVVLGIDRQEGASDVVPFLRKLRIPYPVALDANGDVSAKYGVAGLPMTFLVDKTGVIVSRNIGIVRPSYFKQQLQPRVTGS